MLKRRARSSLYMYYTGESLKELDDIQRFIRKTAPSMTPFICMQYWDLEYLPTLRITLSKELGRLINLVV